jgi:hypothetical protein
MIQTLRCTRIWCLIFVLVSLAQGVRGREGRTIGPSGWRYNKDTFRVSPVHRQDSPARFSLRKSVVLGIPRGGFNVATTTATAAASLLGLNGGFLVANPSAALRQIYQVDPSRQPGEAKLCNVLTRSMGSVSIGVAITLYSSTVLQRSLEVAVALGLIPRLLCFGWILALYQRTPFLVINSIMGCWCTFSLLMGLDTAQKTWRIFSGVSMIKGLALVVTPRTALQRFLGVSIIGNKPQALAKAFGNEVATSALLMGTLAFGLSPSRAAGSVCLFWIVLLADMAWIDKTWKLLEENGPRTQYIQMVIATLLATGFFLS